MVIEEVMQQTFAMRRREILSNSCNVQTLFNQKTMDSDTGSTTVLMHVWWGSVCNSSGAHVV